MKGLVTITKVYKNGDREIVCSKSPNILTQGFAFDMVNLMTAGAKADTSKYKFGYFQLGTSSYYDDSSWTDSLPFTSVRNFSRLHSPIATASDYGLNTSLELTTRNCLVYDEDFVSLEDITYSTEPAVLGILNENNCFPLQLPGDDENGVVIKITLDYGALVGKSIKEFGLYTRDPDISTSEDTPILSCYKSLTDPIEKTDEFMVEIDWLIQFVGTSKRMQDRASLISFYPAGIKPKIADRYAVQNVGYMEAGETREVIIETQIPTAEDAYLYYNVYENGHLGINNYAVSGEHWCIVDDEGLVTSAFDSPIFWPKNTTQIKFTVSALPSNNFFGQKTLAFELSSYTGRDKFIDFNEYLDGNVNVWHIRSDKTAPSLGFSSTTYSTTAGFALSSAVSSNGPIYETSAFVDVSTNAASYMFGTRGPLGGSITYTGPYDASDGYHVIPLYGSIQPFAVSTDAASQFNISLLNTPSGEPIYNLNTYSLDLRSSFQRPTYTSGTGVPPDINYLDISANRNDISIGYEGPWTVENGMFTTANLEGFPTASVQSCYDLYETQPPDGVIMRHFLHGSQPDGILPASFFYSPQELYVWPDDAEKNQLFVGAAGKRRPGQYDYLQDGTGRRSGGDWETQIAKFNSDLSTVVFSTYIKKLDDVVEDPNRTTLPAPSSTSNECFAMNIIVRGYPGVGFYASQQPKTAMFKWNSDGGIDPIKCYVSRLGAFTYSSKNSAEIQYVSSVGYDKFYDESIDFGKQLSSSQYGVIGILEGDDIGVFQPPIVAPVASGYLNITSSVDYSFPFSPTTGHTLSAVGGQLSLSSIWEPQDNKGPFGFTSSGPGLKYDMGVFSGTNGGDTNASRDIAAYGYTDPFCRDGWYRVWVAAEVPEDFYETSLYGAASPEEGGAIHERNIIPSISENSRGGGLVGITQPDYRAGIQGNTGTYYEVPSVTSGVLLAWNQYEQYTKTGSFTKGHSNGYMPRPYQPREYSWFTPRGNAFTNDLATSSITMTFT